MTLPPLAWGGIGLATGVVSGAIGQRIMSHVQEPKWDRYDRDVARVPDDLRGQIGEPNGSVATPAAIAAGVLGTVGMFGSVIEAQTRQAGGDAPSSMAFMVGGIAGSILGANLMRAIAGDAH